MEGAENEIGFAPDDYNTVNLGSPHEDITEIPVHSPIITHSAGDETEIPSHSPRKKKRRKKTRSDFKTKEQIPETTITTVLNELQDDIVDEPKISSPNKDENLMLDGSSAKSYHLVSGEVYLQKNYGFVKVPRAKALNSLDSDADQGSDGNKWNTPTTSLEVAIFAQGCLKPLFTLCHGLLGGLSLATCIMSYSDSSAGAVTASFVVHHSHYIRILETVFFLLAALCMISVLDRFDLYRQNYTHFGDLVKYQGMGVLVSLVYLSTLILTLVATKWGDGIVVYHNNKSHWEDNDAENYEEITTLLNLHTTN
uniref:(California timema) hypothetical protein n=1 Tax=Timema californicum TaxID=61474 RepID=A0A7R9P5V6_TIMCA|nr:unnamed protein product [Timema californicum]